MESSAGSRDVAQALADATGLTPEELAVRVAAGALVLTVVGVLRALEKLSSLVPATPHY